MTEYEYIIKAVEFVEKSRGIRLKYESTFMKKKGEDNYKPAHRLSDESMGRVCLWETNSSTWTAFKERLFENIKWLIRE